MSTDLLDRLFSLKGKTVLITGGYSGIGRTFAETFAELGQKVIKSTMPMRRLGVLEELKSTAVYLATCPPFSTGVDLYIDGGHGL